MPTILSPYGARNFGVTGLEHVKRVKVEKGDVVYLNLVEPSCPHTWTMTLRSRLNQPLQADVLQCHFIDTGFDCLGRREYVAAKDIPAALESKTALPVYTEDMVNEARKNDPTTVVWCANYCYSNCSFQDYHIVEDLCFGSNKLIISNEQVLLTPPALSAQTVFDNVALVVNCHMASPPKYGIRTRKVVCKEVHAMSRVRGSSDSALYVLNQEIWEGLQSGNVVIHCLAGVHRAACVVVSHALFRHYHLGHSHIPSDIPLLYARLAQIRKGVAPLGYIALVESFRAYLEEAAKKVQCAT